jgi:RNA polymerase sigma-70 factor, ECF subfamily
MESLSDEELVARYRSHPESAGRERFIDELFRRHHRRVGVWCYRITGDREAAADLAQEIFVKAFRNFESFRNESAFTTWLYSIARNHCANELKSRARNPEEIGEPLDFDLVADRNIDPLAEIQKRQTAEFARTLMQSCLDQTEIQVMTLHYADEMPLDTISRLLGLTNASGAKAYIVSAKRKLNAAIQRMGANAAIPGDER